jgi:hypothetical protein
MDRIAETHLGSAERVLDIGYCWAKTNDVVASTPWRAGVDYEASVVLQDLGSIDRAEEQWG